MCWELLLWWFGGGKWYSLFPGLDEDTPNSLSQLVQILGVLCCYCNICYLVCNAFSVFFPVCFLVVVSWFRWCLLKLERKGGKDRKMVTSHVMADGEAKEFSRQVRGAEDKIKDVCLGGGRMDVCGLIGVEDGQVCVVEDIP